MTEHLDKSFYHLAIKNMRYLPNQLSLGINHIYDEGSVSYSSTHFLRPAPKRPNIPYILCEREGFVFQFLLAHKRFVRKLSSDLADDVLIFFNLISLGLSIYPCALYSLKSLLSVEP